MALIRPKVKLDHTGDQTALGTVVIGLGDPNPDHSGQAVILNHKGYRAQRLASVSQFVATASDQMWSMWKERVATPADADVLVTEDYSLDTCLAWLLFVARLEGRPLSSAATFDEAAWVDYATAWEEGRFVDAAMETSPACLFTVLGHALLAGAGADASRGFGLCLQFLQEILDACPTPSASGLPPSFDSELRRQAVAQIGFDRQQYETALQRGKTFQLLLPNSVLGSGAERLLIVDALELEETEPTGILKTMARTDRSNGWTHRGFVVLALYRPSQVGTGNDMTVSVDPISYLALDALWRKLEELEDERWGSARPRDVPRPLVSYADATGATRPGSPNEPWWDDNGKYTLIGAPRNNGSRLDWKADVLPTLWELHFLRHVRDLVTFTEQREHAHKHVHVAVWRPIPDGSDSYRLLPDTPSFQAWLAACSRDSDPRSVRSPMQLPGPDAFERVPFEGGYALITPEGVTFFDEAGSLVLAKLLQVAERMAEVVGSHTEFLAAYAKRLEGWTDQLKASEGPSRDVIRDLDDWQRKLAEAQVHVLRTDARLATLPPGLDAEKVRTSLARMWGLNDRRDEVRGLIDRLDRSMRQSIARRTERRERVVGSLVSAAALAIAMGQLWGPIAAVLPLSTYEGQIWAVIVRAFGFGLGLCLFWLLGIRGASKQ